MPKSGMPLPPASAAPEVTSLDRSEESATTLLYRAAIGQISTDYYLPVFLRFEAADRAGPSWNWAASLNTLNWLVFRRLWGAAVLYAGAMLGSAILVFGMGGLLFPFSNTVVLGLLAWGGLSFVLSGVYGNALLHVQSRKKMAHALSASNTLVQAAAMLNQQAGSRRHFVWLGLANVFFAGAVVAVYLSFSDRGKASPASPQMAEVRNFTEGRATDLSPISVTVPAPMPVPVPAAAATLAEPLQSAPAPLQMSPPVSASVPVRTQHFYINVGLFAEESNAHKAHSTLLDAGLAAFTQELNTRKGKRIRVRVGPFDTQSEADVAAGKIHALKLEAVVFEQ